MDIIEHQPTEAQKNALTALMFKGALQAPQSLKKRNPLLLHHDGNFHLIQEGKHSKIPFENVKGFKEKLTPVQFKAFLKNGGYLWLSKNDQDDYFVEAKVRGLGGGVGGANVGFYTGKFLTHFVGHGAIQLAAICTGPAYWATVVSLEATFGPTIEATSNVVGLGTGILGGVATGLA